MQCVLSKIFNGKRIESIIFQNLLKSTHHFFLPLPKTISSLLNACKKACLLAIKNIPDISMPTVKLNYICVNSLHRYNSATLCCTKIFSPSDKTTYICHITKVEIFLVFPRFSKYLELLCSIA